MPAAFFQAVRLRSIHVDSGAVPRQCRGIGGSHRSVHDLDPVGRCPHQLRSDPLRRWVGETEGLGGRCWIDDCERRSFCLQRQLLASAGREHIWRNQSKVNMLTVCAVDAPADKNGSVGMKSVHSRRLRSRLLLNSHPLPFEVTYSPGIHCWAWSGQPVGHSLQAGSCPG